MQTQQPAAASADAGSKPAITALLNRSKNLLLVQAWLNRPEGVAFAKGSINALSALQRGASDFGARRDAESPSGYQANAIFQAAWASLPDNIERLTMAQVQDFLHAQGVQLAADTVTNGDIDGVVDLKNDVITVIDQHNKHDAAPAAVCDGAVCHGDSFVMAVDIQRDGIVTSVHAL